MLRRDFSKYIVALGAGLVIRPSSHFSLQSSLIAPDPSVKRVLVMFKCHFDAGFTDTQANVVKRYFDEYFPRAIQLALEQNSLRRRSYCWTTGSWLLYEYLEQASTADRKRIEQAIERGDIAWHALPFSLQTEMLDQSMIEGSLVLSQSLDGRFGRTTTGAKMTDVPGHTRGLVAPLSKHGVKFLDIGVNHDSMAAQLPPVFLWKDSSGASLPVMYHQDYGGVARIPSSDLVVDIEVRANDNSGPHTPSEIAAIYQRLSHNYPNADITAASLAEIADAVGPYRDSLPVVTGEVGDTWIYGIASDPLKVARYREIARLRSSWIASNQIQRGGTADLSLLRHMLLEVEHTWGVDTKTWLDFDNYKPGDLERMLDTPKYNVVQSVWQEKRQDLLDGIATLPVALRELATNAIRELKPKPPLPTAGIIPRPVNGTIETTHYILDVDPQTGAIVRLLDKATGREWASRANPIALFTYQTLSHEDYVRYITSYATTRPDLLFADFGKPNIEKFGARSQEWHPKLTSLVGEDLHDGHRILATLQFWDVEAFQLGRAAFPSRIYVELVLPSKEPAIYLNLYWFQKPATRMPEAMWLTFNPIAEDQHGWELDKSGESISPFEVVSSGNRHMHAVSKSFGYREQKHAFTVETLDAPLVALGERTPLLFSNNQPDLSKGVHSNLFNNAWGTNYIMWYGEDMRFRYVLRGR
jgi:Domain of unknown function (DUF5054)